MHHGDIILILAALSGYALYACIRRGGCADCGKCSGCCPSSKPRCCGHSKHSGHCRPGHTCSCDKGKPCNTDKPN